MMVSAQDRHDLLDGVRKWCEQHLEVTSLDEAKELAVAISREVGQAIVEQGAKQIEGKATYDGCSVACACAQRAGVQPRRAALFHWRRPRNLPQSFRTTAL